MDNQYNNLNNGIGETPVQPQPMNNTINQGVVEPQSVNPQPVQPQFTQPMQPAMNTVNSGAQSSNIKNMFEQNKKMWFIVGGAVLAIIAIIVVYFVFFAKGNVLTCTMNDSSMGMDMETVMKVQFKNDKASKVDATMTVDLGIYGSYADTFVDQFESQFSYYETLGVDTDIQTKDNKVIIKMSASNENVGLVSETDGGSYNEVKKELEAQGFSCK